jgi:hypothetical protein
MSPEGQIRGGKVAAPSNVYTALLGLACLAVLATLAFVAIQCYTQYDTIFKIP